MSAVLIASVVHGSRLFGTDNIDSDTDIKSVWLPSAKDILLGRMDWTRSNNDSSRQNEAEDVDDERHDLVRFLNLVAAGHPTAVEMLFAPTGSFTEEPDKLWHDLRKIMPWVLTSDISRFMGFVQNQAVGFGIGGERLEAVEKAVKFLAAEQIRSPKATVGDIAELVVAASASNHVRIDLRENGERLLFIAGRSVHFQNKAGDALRIARNFIESFNSKVASQGGVSRRDWRAISHAVRLAEEAYELCTSGKITLPRPNAETLVEIKMGAVPAPRVAEMMEVLIADVAVARRQSKLPDKPDQETIEEFVVEAHLKQVDCANVVATDLNLS